MRYSAAAGGYPDIHDIRRDSIPIIGHLPMASTPASDNFLGMTNMKIMSWNNEAVYLVS